MISASSMICIGLSRHLWLIIDLVDVSQFPSVTVATGTNAP